MKKPQMKHLGNCTYDEFIAQAAKLHDPLFEWVKATDAERILDKYTGDIGDDATDAHRMAAFKAFIAEMEIAAFRKCPELTRQVLCLATFTDDFSAHSKTEFIQAAISMYLDPTIRDFFIASHGLSRATS